MRLRTVLIELLGLNPNGLAENFGDFHLSASMYVCCGQLCVPGQLRVPAYFGQ